MNMHYFYDSFMLYDFGRKISCIDLKLGWNNLLMINDLLYEVIDMFRFERDFQKKHEILKATT